MESEIEPRINALFMAMMAAFPGRFIGQFPTAFARTAAKQLWQANLRDLSDEQIDAGIKKLGEWNEDMLPGINDFKLRLCPAKKNNNFFIPLSKPNSNPEVRCQAIEEIKRIVAESRGKWSLKKRISKHEGN